MTLAIRGRVMPALLALPLLCLPATVRASGFALETQGARAMGFADAYVAQKDDPSALAYNAAGIAFLKYKQVSIGGHLPLRTDTTDSTGLGPYPPVRRLENSDQGLGALPAIYYAQPVGEIMAFGFGFDSPFGFKNSWADPTTSTGRFTCMECEISTWRVNPTVALKLADRFAVGGGVDVLFSKFSITRRMVLNPQDLTDVAETTVATNTTAAVGWNVGVLASPSETLTIGLAYRNKVTVTHSATATFTQILTNDKVVDDAVAAGLPATQAAEVAFNYPGTIAAGVAWHGDRWTVEGDVTRTLWSSLDQFQITHRDTQLDHILPENFADTWKAALGVEYLLRDDWAVRGGYSYETSPQPDPTLSPFLVDSSRNAFSLGGSHIRENLRVDAAVRLTLRGSRTTDGKNLYGYEATYNPAASFAAGLSIGYKF